MDFTLIDRIISVEDKRTIRVVKNLSMGEGYLRDHFPGNPVMPGVLMLEAMIQAGGWLIRIAKDFSVSVIVLAEAKNVKYGKFIVPGDTLECTVELLELGDGYAEFRGTGRVDGNTAVRASFKLRFFNLSAMNQSLEYNDRRIRESAISKFRALGGNSPTIGDA